MGQVHAPLAAPQLPVAVRPRAPAPRDDSAAAPLAFQAPPPLRQTKSILRADSSKHALREALFRDYFPQRPHTSLLSASNKSPPSCHFPRWLRIFASQVTASGSASDPAALPQPPVAR